MSESKRKRRALTVANLLDKRPGRLVRVADQELEQVIGAAEELDERRRARLSGWWLVYGAEKNGKTWFVLKLIKALAVHHKVVYISAEEGIEGAIVGSFERAGITRGDKNITIEEYIPINSIVNEYKGKRRADIIVIDNITIYSDELKNAAMKQLRQELAHKLLIFVAHEERNEPVPSQARYVKKLASVYVRVRGLVATVISRYGEGGGEYVVNEGAARYHGDIINV